MALKRAVKRKLADATTDDPILTDIDTDSETEDLQVRLPHGIPLDTLPPDVSPAVDQPVEQECQRQPREQYIEMSIFPWMSGQLDSDPAPLASGPTPPSTTGQQPYWRTWSEPVPTRPLRPYPCSATCT